MGAGPRWDRVAAPAAMGKKYKVAYRKGGKKCKKSAIAEADELEISRKAGKAVFFHVLRLFGFMLVMMGVSIAVKPEDLRVTARRLGCLDCSGSGWASDEESAEAESSRSVFDRLDADYNDQLDRSELQRGAVLLNGRPLTPQGLDAAMAEMDFNHDEVIDREEFAGNRQPGLWMLLGVMVVGFAYCLGGLVGGKKQEVLTLRKQKDPRSQQDEWTLTLSDLSWKRVTTGSTVYSLRRDFIARVGMQTGRKITAYAVYIYVEDREAAGQRKEVRVWAGNRQRAEFVMKCINKFFHGPTGRRSLKSIITARSAPGSGSGSRATGAATEVHLKGGTGQRGLVKFGSPSLWKSAAHAPAAAELADGAMRDWAMSDWAEHAPLLHAENEDRRLSPMRAELEPMGLAALRGRAREQKLEPELAVAELAVQYATALRGGAAAAAAQLRECLQHAERLLGRPIHHTTREAREELQDRVQEILADLGDERRGLVGAICAMRRLFGQHSAGDRLMFLSRVWLLTAVAGRRRGDLYDG